MTRTSRGLLAIGSACLLVTAVACAPEGNDQPWPQRPVVDLDYRVADDLSSATGRERVVFTPDMRVCELVFRLWPNEPTAARTGTSIVVTGASVDGRPVAPRPAADAAAGSQGTLVELPLGRCVQAGDAVTAVLDFRLTLGRDSGERWGYLPSREMAWFGNGFPLLPWVRGQGWARDAATVIPGETATSEDFELASLSVTAPSRLTVFGTGTRRAAEAGRAPGTTIHHFAADAVRDVLVTVGNFDVLERTVSGVQIRLATPKPGRNGDGDGNGDGNGNGSEEGEGNGNGRGTKVSPQRWMEEISDELRALQHLLGPLPYRDLWVTVVPTIGDGVEFPTALLFGDLRRKEVRSLVAHELGHQWFYALVGNNQARDPWIDESFTTFVQALVVDQQDDYRLEDVPRGVVGHLGEPMDYWGRTGGYDNYVAGVYQQGAAVLLEARRRAGPQRFDRTLRDYVARSAHRVVGPRDVLAAFHDLPQVTDLLRQYGVREGGNR
ncbi:hypothetical protein HUO13_22820 [Saccharopolyspora erythraea]|uniref:M1 family aminopeptidase n=1 Tax=Saccharopolyspora erythraea TaxID=1836 RepID=UPI001BA7C6A3|nr:M1 family aminopeptidase [Saccharopolyspora erythraea]QUH03285.1 hypothetical protein HUO13_22820 [Saccharopolyspora erythraea]